jgi:nucleoside-triphosphatase THEP1
MKTQKLIQRLTIITGERDCGKTTWCRTHLDPVSTDGVLQLKVFSGSDIIGYDAMRFSRGDTVPLLRKNVGDGERIGMFTISGQGFQTAAGWLDEVLRNRSLDILIDEVGKWELRREGFYQQACRAIGSESKSRLYLVVRKPFLQQVAELLEITGAEVIEIDNGEVGRRYTLTS